MSETGCCHPLSSNGSRKCNPRASTKPGAIQLSFADASLRTGKAAVEQPVRILVQLRESSGEPLGLAFEHLEVILFQTELPGRLQRAEMMWACWAGWAAKVMKAAGLTETDDPAQLVDRPTLAAFIALMEDSLKVRAAADFLGLTMESMRNLVRAGGIRPWAGGQGSEIHLWMFRRSELREFLESVTRFNGPRKRRPPAGTVTISQAVRRPGVTTVDLLARLRSGQIECAGLLAGKRLIPAILIRKADLDSTWSVTDDDWVTTTEVVRMLGITHANISALATFGVLDVSRPLRKARLYRKDAVEAFRRGYVSSTEAATILRTHARIVHHELRWEGIRASLPLPPERLEAYLHRKSALKWFLRAEVEALALRGGITKRIKRVPRTGNPVAVGKASSDPGSNSATLSG